MGRAGPSRGAPHGPPGARPLCSTAVVSRSTCLTPGLPALGLTGAHPGVRAGSRESRTGRAEAPSAAAPFSLPSPLLWPAATQGGGPQGGAASLGQSSHPSFTLTGVPVPPAWVTHECLNSGSHSGACPLLSLLVPLPPCPSLDSASTACILPTPSAPSPSARAPPPSSSHCPPSSPILCLCPLATPIAPLTPFPQEHPGSSVPLLPASEALPGCASPMACPYLRILHPWSPHQSTLAMPQVVSSPFSPGHPVTSDPDGDGSSPLHPKVPEPPFPAPQASASQTPPSPRGPLSIGWVGGMGQSCLGEGRCGLLPGLEQEGALPKGWLGRGHFLTLLQERLCCFCPSDPCAQH